MNEKIKLKFKKIRVLIYISLSIGLLLPFLIDFIKFGFKISTLFALIFSFVVSLFMAETLMNFFKKKYGVK